MDTSGRSLVRRLRTAKPAAIVLLTSRRPRLPTRLIDPAAERSGLVQLYFKNDELSKMFEALPAGRTDAKVSITAPAPVETPAVLRNVVGVLRGSDPVLKNSYVFVTAHYDHLGMKTEGDGDRIYNGANDDGSGTVSAIEIAGALASMEHRPNGASSS